MSIPTIDAQHQRFAIASAIMPSSKASLARTTRFVSMSTASAHPISGL
jgi:hypothetical protein